MNHSMLLATVVAVVLGIPSVSLRAQKDPSPTAAAQAAFYGGDAWQRFLDETGGSWRVEWSAATNTPRAIYGTGITLRDWRENTLEEARRHALALLQQRADLLGLGSSEFHESIGSRMGRTWSFTFDQSFRGLPVLGGRADVRVNMAGRIAMFGSCALPLGNDFVTRPAIDAETAHGIAWQAVGQVPTGVKQPAAVTAPRLVIWGDLESTAPVQPVLAWEVAISNVGADGTGPIGRWLVDAQSGKALRFLNDKHECGLAGCGHTATTPSDGSPAPVLTTITLMGWTRTGLDANDPVVNVPLPGVQITVPGIGVVTTNQVGQADVFLGAPVTVTMGNLDGRHHAAMLGANGPSGTFVVNPGGNTTIQLLTAAATANESAHTSTSWWIDRTNEFCRALLGNTAQLNTASNIVPTVNIALTCNAYYSGNTINFYQAGGGCSNTGNNTVVVHEWGHGLDERYGGISNTSGQGLSEGWGDLLAMYVADDSRVGSGFQTPNVGLRDGNNTYQYGTATGVHTAGQSWMGFAWKLRNRLATTHGNRNAAILLTNDIVLGTIVANATNQPNAVTEVFLADDNDGNLLNGTPNTADLIWACNQHSLPYPATLPALTNDECAGAIHVVAGANGPFTNVGSTTSAAWPCASGANDVWFVYDNYASGPMTVTTCGSNYDSSLEVFTGNCTALSSVACNDDSCGLQSSVTFAATPNIYYIRVGGFIGHTGSITLNITGPAGGSAASATAYGTGCLSGSTSFYEYFNPAAGFDLNGMSMRMALGANRYVVQSGTTYIAPAGATTLALSDDSSVTVNLPATFTYPGGTTTSLEVCSNGFVSVGSANGAPFTPSSAGWLASAATRWGTWHDFNPGAAGSGSVKTHVSGNKFCVTWDGVYSYGTTNPNTWQLQFNTQNGDVTMVWNSMQATGNPFLVGFARSGGASDLGSRDVSATLPATFTTFTENLTPLALASTLPVLGSTFTLTTSNFPSGSGIGLQILSVTRIDPGIDLTAAGMPGCFAYVGLDVLYVVLPVGHSAYYPMLVPANPNLVGAQIAAQSAALFAEANALGLLASNGMALTIGL